MCAPAPIRRSPFSEAIRASFELVRLICTNGMVGLTPFFNAKIPLVNRWEEHLEIAHKQIQNKVQSHVRNRIIDMGTERATVGELSQIASHAMNRIDKFEGGTREQQNRLRSLRSVADPAIHMRKYYKDSVFENMAIAHRLPGHLTTMDAWNIVTEMLTHTEATEKSTETALQRMANSLMFDYEKREKRMANIDAGIGSVSSFSDPTAAFFGNMQ